MAENQGWLIGRRSTLSKGTAMPDTEFVTMLERLEQKLPVWDRAACLHLVGLLERLKAHAWVQILGSQGSQHDTADVQESDRLLTIPQVAKRLAISDGRAYELARQGKLPNVKVGKYVRVEPAALDAWVAQHREGTLDTRLYTAYSSSRHDRKRSAKTPQPIGPDPGRPGRAARRHDEHRGPVGTRRDPDPGADGAADHSVEK